MSSDKIESMTDCLLQQWPQQYLSLHMVFLQLDFDNPILGRWSTSMSTSFKPGVGFVYLDR